MSEGIFTPNYGLSEFTRKAVKEAGVGGEKAAKARAHLAKADMLGKIGAGVDTVGKQADEMVGSIKANNAAKKLEEEKAKLAIEAAEAATRGQEGDDRYMTAVGPGRDEYYAQERAAAGDTLENWEKRGKPLSERVSLSGNSPVEMKSPAKSLSGLSEVHDSQSEELPAFDEADLKWREGFSKMNDRQSWASPELYSQFQSMERREKEKHLTAIRNKDKAGAAKVLADQSARANALKDIQQTMTTAMQIDKDHGWNVIIEGDDDQAKGNREILSALASNDGTAKVALDPESGEMGFTLGEIDPATSNPLPNIDPITGQLIGTPKVWMHREIDELISVGTRPLHREETFQNGIMEANALGTAGGEFDADARNKINKGKIKEELIKNPKVARSILHDTWGGDNTLAEDLMEGNVIQNMDFRLKMPRSFGTWKRPLPDGPAINELDVDNDGFLTAADLTQGDVARILQELEKREHYKLLAEIAGDWMTRKEQNVHGPAKANYDAQQEQTAKQAEADKLSQMTEQQRMDYFKTLGDARYFSGKTAAEKIEYYKLKRAKANPNA